MATCTILASDGTPHDVSNLVLDSAAAVWEIDGIVLDSAGTAVVVCVVTVTEFVNAGGEDPEHKRRRYQLMELQKEDKLILLIIKQYMN